MGRQKPKADSKKSTELEPEPKLDPSPDRLPKAKPEPKPEPQAAKTEGPPKKTTKDSKPDGKKPDGYRETIESVVIAFVLAFLFRTFEAEAFVIPTGSMAETLYGRHKDVICEKCETPFRVSASDEVSDSGVIHVDEYEGTSPRLINYGICPNCRFPNDILNELSFKGDRILVNKFPYEFGDPDRFDVVVFKFPEEAKTNYIKRLVGLPGETIKIEWGDLYARKSETEAWSILRKNPDKQRVLQIPVYDNDHPARQLLEAGWPERWAAVRESADSWVEEPGSWSADTENRTFNFAASADPGSNELQWIRYRHFVPYVSDWEHVLQKDQPPVPMAQLITDFSSYNAGISVRDAQVEQDSDSLLPSPTTDVWGTHWVGDLTFSCEVDVLQKSGELVLELVEGSRWFRCVIDLSNGQAALKYVDTALDRTERPLPGAELAQTPLGSGGVHQLCFSNFDDRLLLWVDDEVIDFGEGGGNYPSPAFQAPSSRDLAPVGLAVRGSSVQVSHLNVTRDIFYLSCARSRISNHSQTDYRSPARLDELKRFLSDPELAQAGIVPNEGFQDMVPNEFQLGEDEFFVLGDNSARSRDSRLWTKGRVAARGREGARDWHVHAVPRDLLIGKAFFIYWPHGVPFLNGGKGFPVRWHPQPKVAKGRHGYRYVKQNGVVVLENSDQPSWTVPFYPQWQRWQRIR